MIKVLKLISMLFIATNCISQVDTLRVINQHGFLLLSHYNFQYDEKEGSEMNPLGFHDFFFPSEKFDLGCLLDSNKSILFKNGIRLDFYDKRQIVKKKATLIRCRDTSFCYPFKDICIIPVSIDYRIFEDYWPFECDRNYFDLKIMNGADLRFQYLHKAFYILNLREIGDKAKKK